MKTSFTLVLWLELHILLVMVTGSERNYKQGSPKLQPFAFPPNIQSGKSMKIFCTVEEGQKPLEFQWLYNNGKINQSQISIAINNFEDYSMLIIDPVSVHHAGNYTCSTRNAVGDDSYTTSLVVQESAKWAKQPEDVFAMEGELVFITCAATGHPKPKILWNRIFGEKNRSSLESQESVLISPNGTLTIHNIRQQHSGKYECNASNGIGDTLTTLFSITVHGKVVKCITFCLSVVSNRIKEMREKSLLNCSQSFCLIIF